MKPHKKIFATILIFLGSINICAQVVTSENFKLKNSYENGFTSLFNKSYEYEVMHNFYQKPSKKIYFVPGGKIGMFFLQGDFNGNQLIALEAFGRYVGEGFWAEISIPFRFKTSPAFTDIGIDVNVMYPFLGTANKSELDPFVGGGLGLHFIGRDKDDPGKTTIAARGGLGLNLIAGCVFFKNYDFNIILELKYFNYLREFDDKRYQGIGLNIGVVFPK